MPTKPVWAWMPGQTQPRVVGEFSLANGVGRFKYATDYQRQADAIRLDPRHLPFTRSKHPIAETRQQGLFGVFRDASPEGFGLALLERIVGHSVDDPLERLEASIGDAVGAIEVCDDIDRKMGWSAPTSDKLFDALARLEPEQQATAAAREVMKVQGTSLGGERPKLTVLHKGQLWIAKLPLRADIEHTPLREHAAMEAARRAGLHVAETEFVRVGTREVLLVKRFDRDMVATGMIMRRLYASAHTVLGLAGTDRDDRARSYVGLAVELQRWTGPSAEQVREQRRELFRRMAFNAVCGNGDDHPRNHGLVFEDGSWKLSPAFDIAPGQTFSRTLSMAVNRKHQRGATVQELVRDCTSFAYEPVEAEAFIRTAVATLKDSWPKTVAAAGKDPAELTPLVPDWL